MFEGGIWAKPGSKRASVGGSHDGRLIVAVTTPPADGAANRAIVTALSRALGVRGADVEIVKGATGRAKWVRINAEERGLAQRWRQLLDG